MKWILCPITGNFCNGKCDYFDGRRCTYDEDAVTSDESGDYYDGDF